MNYLKIASLILIISFEAPVFAQSENSVLEIQRINSHIEIDGLSDEEAWKNVKSLPLELFQPVFRGDPSNRSEILVVYDDNYLYLAGRFYFNDLSKVSMNTFKRDGFSNSDCFNIIIDTYNDNENAMYFMTTPSGLRRDCLISNDASFGRWMNLDWNTFWDTHSIVNEQGWFAEVRIPFSSLRFQDDNGEVTMGLLVHRYTIKLMERVTFPAVSPDLTDEPFKPSMAYDIKLRGVYSDKPTYITPYMMTGAGRNFSLNSMNTEYLKDTDNQNEIGLDVKYNLTSNMVLDLTANTDFAQVEADDQQVNLTRFSLYFPEKRRFFQERSNIFDFGTGGRSSLFHSRNIGISGEGEIVRILGGARLVGRIGEWDMGFLDMQTEESGDKSSENFGVFRLRKRVLNPYTYVGGMITNRYRSNGSMNTGIGLDGTIRLQNDDYIIYNAAFTANKDERISLFDNSRIRARWERRRIRGLLYNTEVIASGSDYDPGIGFILRENMISGSQTIGYGFSPSKEARLRNARITLNVNAVRSNLHNELETLTAQNTMFFETKKGMYLFINSEYSHENIFNKFYLETGSNEVFVPSGRYDFAHLRVNWGLGEGRKISPSFGAQTGSFYDGNIIMATLRAGWYFSKYINFNTNYTYNRITFPDRVQTFRSHLAGIRTEFTMNTSLSLNSFIQYNSVLDKFVSNVRFRYNFSEGNDLYIVYNETLNTERRKAIPGLPYSDNCAIVMKFTKTFIK